MSKVGRLLSCALVLAFLSSGAWAQGIFATLTGIVTDPSQSVVPNAKVTLRDVGSGSERQTTTNGEGYYTFASVPVGTYALIIEATGFKTTKEDAIRLGGGEQRNVNVALAVGGSTETVEVTGVQDFTTAPVDTGEKSFTLETKELQNFTQVGSNAAEYIKIVPGFGITNGTQNKSNYNGETIGINANGDSGSQSPLNAAFSYNGLPVNSLDITADGAHVSDPGCNCDTPVNPNSDFLQEFKVLTSNFSAEEQKGPIVITSVTKSGGNAYHGNAFFSARNHVLNSNDWLNNFSNVPQPANKYYYPGGSIGGPVPKLKNKLFFFTGFEYFYQVLDTGLLRATVPTSSELGGDFSPSSIAGEGPLTAAGKAPGQLTSGAIAAFGGTTIPMCTGTPNGKCIDPNMLALAKLFPSANATPTTASPYNYIQAEIFNQNNRQWVARGDYNLSDNTKVFVRYNYQREVQQFPVGLWWRNGDQVPYPTPIEGKNKSDSWAGTITHVFSPTMTNETVMAYTFVGFPNVFENPSKVAPSTVGYTYKGLFGNIGSKVNQIPSFGNFGPSEAALVFNPGGFEAGGPSEGLYANKWMPSVSDTLTKVIGTHTIKAGFFYEWIRNAQPANNNTNGEALVSAGNTFSYGNEYADLLTGNLNSYTETNFNRINDISYNTVEFFGQDSWKATKRMTLEFGLRFTHFSPWVDDENFGYSIFNPALYSSANGGACASAPTFCGFEWHAKDSSVPLGGFPTRSLFYQPRLGVAYDLFGSGNTVLRGGWGRFYYHSGQFTSGLDASAGVATANLSPTNWVGGAGCPSNNGGAALFASYIDCLNTSATPASPAAVDRTDNMQPYTDSWSFTVSQRTPWQSRLEVAYVGNRSRDIANAGGYGSNLNLVPAGAMFSATDPVTGKANTNPSLANANDWRPIQGYGDLNQATNNAYSNYNALQVTWGRHAGRYTMQANYTWQKSLGIVEENVAGQSNYSISLNPFNLGANYGEQPTDRHQLFNFAYSVDLGNPLHAKGFVGGATAGWQVSGIAQLQSGANLTYGGAYNSNPAYNMSLTCVSSDPTASPCPQSAAIIPGSISTTNPTGIAITPQSITGTNAFNLFPLVTCNPNSGRSSHQFVNGNCFAPPTVVGQNGPVLLPVSWGPAFFNWDMALFKNFQITESKRLQFRVSGYNFLNHPLYSFPSSANLTLNFVQDPAQGYAFTQTNTNFGRTTEKQGQRIVEFAVKFYF